MSMAELVSAMDIIFANPNQGFFVGPRDSNLIAKAESALGGALPPTYREFVRRLGAGGFGSCEIYGVIDDEFEHSAVPNGVWLTLNERRESGLPKELFIVGSTGDGDYYCLEMRNGQESPVIVYRPGLPMHQQAREKVAEDFGEFFLGCVREQV